MACTILVLAIGIAAAQDNVGIGTATPDPSALLDLSATNKGLLIPRVTVSQRDAISLPATGLMIYNLDQKEFQYNSGTPSAPVWRRFISIGTDGNSGDFWTLTGNAGTDQTRHYLGTRDAAPLVMKTNDTTRLTISPLGIITADGPVRITKTIDLSGATVPFRLNGQAGTQGQVMISNGPLATPSYTSRLSLQSITTDTLNAGVTNISGPLTVNGPTIFNDTVRFSIFPKLPLPHNNMFVGSTAGYAEYLPPGADSSFLGLFNGRPTWFNLSSLIRSQSWTVGGNATPGSPIIGNMATSGITDLDVRAGGRSLIMLNGSSGLIDIKGPLNLMGNTTPLTLNGNAGNEGSVMVSKGVGQTPVWSGALLVSDTNIIISAPKFTTSSTTTTTHYGPTIFTQLPQIPLLSGHILVGNSQDIAVPLPPGIDGAMLQIQLGRPIWQSPERANYWSRAGNTGIGPTDYIGTTDDNDVRISTNGTTRVNIARSTGSVSMTSLSGAPVIAPVASDDGLVVATGNGTLTKRDKSSVLAMLGIYGGRYQNGTASPEFTVVITLPAGSTLDPQAAISLTPEASSSVSATPFVVNGSRTATTFIINFPGGLNPGEAINWMVKNP